MATVDTYVEYEWKDAPDYQTTPTNAHNFNHMEGGIKKNNTAIKALITELSTKAENSQTFTQAVTRTNLVSGDTISTVFGKIMKWFADTKDLAFIAKDNSTAHFLRGDGTWVTPPNSTYTAGTGLNLSSGAFSVKYGTAAGTACQGNDSRLSNARPASDVYAWAKASTKPSYSKAEVGLGNVDNTADSAKSVAYATNAGSANWANSAGSANAAAGASTHFSINNGYNLLLYSSGATYCSDIWTAANGTLNLASTTYTNLRGGNRVQCRNADDSAWQSIAASAFTVQSSKRYKENIRDISDEEAKKILDVNVVNYDYKKDIVAEGDRVNRHGVIAEDVDRIIPEAVLYDKPEGFKEAVPDGVDYSRFVPYLIKMVQIQQKEIEELRRET